MKKFSQRLASAARKNRSLVCVGLDPNPRLMPVDSVLEFNKLVVDATKDLVCAYKPNLSFYEALGYGGFKDLAETVSYIRALAPEVVVIGDGKRGDVAHSNVGYARALFDVWGFDAATVNAYAGGEALEPFFAYEDRGVFVWCRSSNPGAREFQDMGVGVDGGEMSLYEWMAKRACEEWNARGNVGLVVGATYPQELERVRALCPGMPILIPGVGAQGGALEDSVRLGLDSGDFNVLISSSRDVLYPSMEGRDHGQAVRSAVSTLRDRINRVLEEEGRGW